MSDMGKLSPEQMVAWLILEGWAPWVHPATEARHVYYGVRCNDKYVFGRRPNRDHDGGHGRGARNPTFALIERDCDWGDIPHKDMEEIYSEVIRGFY